MSETNGKAAVNGRGAFYRLARMLHGYLSAAAFLALLFFAATGIVLNHPEWLPQERAPETQTISLDAATLQSFNGADVSEGARLLAAAVSSQTLVVGDFAGSDIVDQEAVLRFQGVRGASTATIDLATGAGQVEVQRAGVLAMLNDLHRGKNAGAAWKVVIDVVGWLTVALSLLGFVIFFSLRFRLVTSMVLVAAGAAAMVGVFLLLVS